MNKFIDILLKLGVATILIIAATTTTQQYTFYLFVRWVVMTTSIYFAYTSFKKKQIGFLIYFSALILLFNPLRPFSFQKETWHLIDYIVSFITLGTLYFEWNHVNKSDKKQNQNT